MKQARLEVSLTNGARYTVWADSVKLRKLKIALSSKMERRESEMISVSGTVYEDGLARAVDLSIMTDQLAGVQLVIVEDVGGAVSQ